MKILNESDLKALTFQLQGATDDRNAIRARMRVLRALISSVDTDLSDLLAQLRAEYESFMNAQVQYNIDFDAWVQLRLTNIEAAFAALDQRRPVVMMGTDAQPAKFAEIDSLGGFNLLGTGLVDQSAGTTLNVTKGIGKAVITVNSGTGLAGSFIVTGDSVDRDTGAITVGDSETILMDWGVVSVNNNGTDADGNATWDLDKCYITTKWFKGTVNIAGGVGTKCTISVYHCSFESLHNATSGTIDALDVNVYTTNANAWYYGYLYHVDVLEAAYLCNVKPVTNVSIPSGTAIAGKYWRLRRSELDLTLATTRAGVFLNMFHGPSPQQYLQDLEWKVWAKVIDGAVVTIAAAPPAPTPPSGGGGGGGAKLPDIEVP